MRTTPHPITILVVDEDQRWTCAVLPELEPSFHVVVANTESEAIHALGTGDFDVLVTEAQIGQRKAAQVRLLVASLAPGLEARTIYTTCGGFDPILGAFFATVRSPVLYKGPEVLRLRDAIYAIAQQLPADHSAAA